MAMSTDDSMDLEATSSCTSVSFVKECFFHPLTEQYVLCFEVEYFVY